MEAHAIEQAVEDVSTIPFRARLSSTDGGSPLRVAGWLTPYDAETIDLLARRMGPGARLEFTLAPRASERSLSWVWQQFSHLDARGVEVSIERAKPGGVD
jgi:hypothetical protein